MGLVQRVPLRRRGRRSISVVKTGRLWRTIGRELVKTFLLAIAAMIGIAWASAIVLEKFQRTADYAYVGYGAKPDPEPSLHGGTSKH